ncbi:baseplate J/gp47 family protein [Chitinophaga rhizophila]|uniref:Baseplate J/gp47 family protein n=1 Tax=Chitinophaga rhizophila TaxID=2866212 RepID=A0ABS7G5I8_9BACT|nr:baseplate J/gp47 family protein [Chitinophaga rhizophila]MBW8682915.1 baseplate J/gp47 family protein [Chitinophaga rhizophila]
MNASDNISNNLVRDGVSQLQRKMEALSTDTVQIDERSTAQLLGFLYRYARYVLYYDDTDQPFRRADTPLVSRGDWQDFFRSNPPFQYAAIQQFDTAGFDAAYQKARNSLSRQLPADQFWSMFFRILDMAMQLNSWQTQLDTTTGLHGMLHALVTADFSKALHRLIAIANTMKDAAHPLPQEAVNNIGVLRSNTSWALTMDKLLAKDAYLDRLSSYPRRKKEKVLAQLDELFLIFYKGIQQVQSFAVKDFDNVMKGAQQHQPHAGLLYAFLQLFSQVKTQMNTLGRQHLNFFYEEVLQLKKKPLIPDHVHLVGELARQLPDYLLQQDTAVKAGKDATGKEVTFYTAEDVVWNKAKVSELRTLFKDDKANIYIAPVAASADGKGEGFRNPAYNSWPLLGAASYVSKNNPAAGTTHFPFGNTGLLLASPVLLLKEGTRQVTVAIQLTQPAEKADQLAALLTKPFYLLNEEVLTAFKKAGVDNGIVSALKVKMKNAGITEKWLDDVTGDNEFRTYTGVSPQQLQLARDIARIRLLQVDCTTAEGWYPAPVSNILFSAGMLTIDFVLAADAPALVAPAPEAVQAVYPVKDPVLRILFNHSLHYHLAEQDEPWYDVLSHLAILNTTINVHVTNIRNLLIGNDEGPLDPNNKFIPFTSVPKSGSNFYIGSDEVFRKKLTAMQLNIEWEGLPVDFAAHYTAYNLGINNTYFTATLQRLNNGQWESVNSGTPLQLFEQDGSNHLQATREITIPEPGAIPVLRQQAPLLPYNNAALYGFLRLRLVNSFKHEEYPGILADQLIKLGSLQLSEVTTRSGALVAETLDTRSQTLSVANKASVLHSGDPEQEHTDLRNASNAAFASADDSYNKTVGMNQYLVGTPGNVKGFPPPPYTPVIKSFSLEYQAAAGAAEVMLLHQYPYEAGNYKTLSAGNTMHFMPVYEDEGTLYIGLQQAVPGTNVNLLFQLAEFTADPDIRKASVKWHYMSGNEWKVLEDHSQIISDTTKDMLVSGIVTIALPWDADTDHTVLPSGYHWLRISNHRYSAAVCECIAVMAQATLATFRNTGNDPARVGVALPAQSVSGLVTPDAMITKISQPFPSFGGRQQETAEEFYIRVSERLRHKGRAINVFDYERIVLDAFPEIFKIKCIPHSKMCRDTEGNITQLSSPGWVTLAVIPRIDAYPADERFSPRVSRIVLEKVSDYLQQRTSAFAKVQVINPAYQPVSFKGSIRLRAGKDASFYLRKLEREVQAYLSPWINTGSQDIVFGGTLMMSSVLQFIEQQDYVDYVTDFTMFVKQGGIEGPPVKAITADTPWSVLVSGEQTYTNITTDTCTTGSQQPVFRIK